MSYSFPKDAKDGDTVSLDNGVEYQYEDEKDRWVVKSVGGASVDGKRKDFIPQLKGSFEIDDDGKAVIPDNAFYISEEDNEDGWKDEIRYPGVWWTGKYYEPSKLTHLLVGQSRYVEGVNEEGEYIYDELEWTKRFYPGDIIRVSASAHELYHHDATTGRDETDHYAQRSDDVWRVTKVLDVAYRDDYPNPWGFWAYELEKVMPKDQYSNRWYIGEDEGEDDWFDKYFSPVSVTHHYIEKETQPFLHFKQRERNAYWYRGAWQGTDSGRYVTQNPKEFATISFSELDFRGSDVTVTTWSAGDTIVLYEEDVQVASFVVTNTERVSSSGYSIKITVDPAQTTGDVDLNPEAYLKTPNPATRDGLDELVKKSGDEMSGDLKMVKNGDGVESKVHTRFVTSGQSSNLQLQHDGNTRVYVGKDQVSFNRPVQLNDEGIDDDHAVSKGYIDGSDKHLQAEIDQIALGLETLLVQREHGQWRYIGFSGDNIPRNAGEFSLVSDDLSSSDNIITLNSEDLGGTTHGFGDVDIGDYVEIVDLDEPANYVLFVVKKAPEGTGISNVEVSLKDKGQNFLIGETCEIRFFAINEQDLSLTDLDGRYIKNGGETTLSNVTKILAGSSGKWLNIQAAQDTGTGFFVMRNYEGDTNLFQVNGDGTVLLSAGRMATDDDEVTTKRYVDNHDGFIKNGGTTTLSETTHILAGSSGKWMNIQAATNSGTGFFVFRNYEGDTNLFQVNGDGTVLLSEGRMATHLDEITTKRYVDNKVSGGTGILAPGRRFKFERYDQGSTVPEGCFSPYRSDTDTENVFINRTCLDGMRLAEGAPDFTPGIEMPVTIYKFESNTWKSCGFGTWGTSRTNYMTSYIGVKTTWVARPTLVANQIYALVIGGKW